MQTSITKCKRCGGLLVKQKGTSSKKSPSTKPSYKRKDMERRDGEGECSHVFASNATRFSIRAAKWGRNRQEPTGPTLITCCKTSSIRTPSSRMTTGLRRWKQK